ncbi:MAG: AarF/ABC1/UbiB kinase family protein [Gammaproteobacteria bacterium]|nr:AarF/ABC1/UbiB kinase family protein [Gammaproteobacteria bacterium]
MSAPQDPRGKSGMRRLTSAPLARNFALARLGLGAGTAIAAHSLANVLRGRTARESADRTFYRRQATVLAAELGRLKGSVMKAGQMLSLYSQYFLPAEAVEVLASLQDSTQPVDWAMIEPVLEKNLGSRLAELEIDCQPLAAASLGQVHRAWRRRDGLQLCIKVQYPGVARAIDSDVRTLSQILLLARLAPKGLDLRPVFAEVGEMLHREVDYRLEAEFTREYAQRLAGDHSFIVPRVVDELSTAEILTTTYETGVGVRDAAVQSLSQSRRNALAEAFIDLFLREFFNWHTVQSDPHFGNYRFRVGTCSKEDRIVLLDFGATRRFEAGFVGDYARIVGGALQRDAAEVIAGARGIGLMHEHVPQPVLDAFVQLCERLVEPFYIADDPRTPPGLRNAGGGYRFGASDLPRRVVNLAARNALSVYFRMPPREIVFLHRRLVGVFIMCSALGAEVDARPQLCQALSQMAALTGAAAKR